MRSKCDQLGGTGACEFGVRDNAVAPNQTEPNQTEKGMLTRFTGTAERASVVPLGRVGQSDEIARPILSLASEAASILTGQIVSADGGKTAGL